MKEGVEEAEGIKRRLWCIGSGLFAISLPHALWGRRHISFFRFRLDEIRALPRFSRVAGTPFVPPTTTPSNPHNRQHSTIVRACSLRCIAARRLSCLSLGRALGVPFPFPSGQAVIASVGRARAAGRPESTTRARRETSARAEARLSILHSHSVPFLLPLRRQLRSPLGPGADVRPHPSTTVRHGMLKCDRSRTA